MHLQKEKAEAQKQALEFVLARYIRTSEAFSEHEKPSLGISNFFFQLFIKASKTSTRAFLAVRNQLYLIVDKLHICFILFPNKIHAVVNFLELYCVKVFRNNFAKKKESFFGFH